MTKRTRHPAKPVHINEAFNDFALERKCLEGIMFEIVMTSERMLCRGDIEGLQELDAEKAEVEVQLNQTKMIEACLFKDWDEVMLRAPDASQELLNAALSAASVHAPIEVVSFLLKSGADPRNEQDNPIARARKAGRDDVVNLLLQRSAVLDTRESARSRAYHKG